MLDIGFAESLDNILASLQIHKKTSTTGPHQTLLFSATLPEWIKKAIAKYMKEDRVTVDLIGNTKLKAAETVTHLSIPSRYQNRNSVIGDVVSVYRTGVTGRAIIFVETKAEANELALHDKLSGTTQVIHGDIAQNQREITLKGFREAKFKCLVATNVMARGYVYISFTFRFPPAIFCLLLCPFPFHFYPHSSHTSSCPFGVPMGPWHRPTKLVRTFDEGFFYPSTFTTGVVRLLRSWKRKSLVCAFSPSF